MSTAAPPEPVSTNDLKVDTINQDMSTSKVGGIPPERPEGAAADTPRFMSATWKDDPEMTKLGGKSIWGYFSNRLRYKGPNGVVHTGKLPVHSYWSQRSCSIHDLVSCVPSTLTEDPVLHCADKFIFPRAVAPLVLQYASMKYLDYSWPLPVAFAIYSISFIAFAINMLHHFNSIAEKHGFLDGQAPRDDVPDVRLTSTAVSHLPHYVVPPPHSPSFNP